jgi:hypothetical protein
MQSPLLPFHANVDPFLQTVNHVVFDCPHHHAACSANSHFDFDDLDQVTTWGATECKSDAHAAVFSGDH